MVAAVVQPFCPCLVVLDLGDMRVAINLDDQRTFVAEEVNDEAIDGMLAAKLEAAQLPIAQGRPQLLFSRGLRLAEFPRSLKDGRVDAVESFVGHGGLVRSSATTPHPNPLPRGEGARAESVAAHPVHSP